MQTLMFMSLITTAFAANSLSFLAIGDWGGNSDSQPTSHGEVDNNKAMGSVARQLGDVKFVMAMGDNFYVHGVQSSMSSRFQSTFESVFTDPSLNLPWYVVAGNHDHYGNATAQVEYTKRCPSKRWKFPSLYYTFSDSFIGSSGKNVSVQVIYVDSVLLAGQSYHDEVTGEFVKAKGPESPEVAASQLEWLEDQLKNSKANYLFVSAHYPIYSQCSHGPTAELQRDVLPLLQKYNATGFLAGHDHCLGHFIAHNMIFVLSGAGKECCYGPNHVNQVSQYMKFRMDSQNTYGSNGGFASVSLTEQRGVVNYYSDVGTHLYSSDAFSPRH